MYVTRISGPKTISSLPFLVLPFCFFGSNSVTIVYFSKETHFSHPTFYYIVMKAQKSHWADIAEWFLLSFSLCSLPRQLFPSTVFSLVLLGLFCLLSLLQQVKLLLFKISGTRTCKQNPLTFFHIHWEDILLDLKKFEVFWWNYLWFNLSHRPPKVYLLSM